MIALSLLAIAIGAILRFAISATLTGIDIPTVGVILMVLGVADHRTGPAHLRSRIGRPFGRAVSGGVDGDTG